MTHRLSDNLLWLYFQKRIRIGGQNKEWTVLFLLKCTLFTYLSIFHTLGRYKRWTSFNFQHHGSENYPDSSIQKQKTTITLSLHIFLPDISFSTVFFTFWRVHFDCLFIVWSSLSPIIFPIPECKLRRTGVFVHCCIPFSPSPHFLKQWPAYSVYSIRIRLEKNN